jgi:hypothetical protein
MRRYKLSSVLAVKNKQDDGREPDDECPEIIVRGDGVTSTMSASNPFTFPSSFKFKIYAETVSSFLMGLLRGVEYLESKEKLETDHRAFVGWIEDTKHQISLRIHKDELPLVQKFLRENLGSENSGIPQLRFPFLVILTELTEIIHDLQYSKELTLFLMTKIARTEAFMQESPEKDLLTGFLLKYKDQEEPKKQAQLVADSESNNDSFWNDVSSIVIADPAQPEAPIHPGQPVLGQAPTMTKETTPGNILAEIEEKKGERPVKTRVIEESMKSGSKGKVESPDTAAAKKEGEMGETKPSEASNQQSDGLPVAPIPENQEKDSDSEEEVAPNNLLEIPVEEEEELATNLEPGIISESFKKELLSPFVEDLHLQIAGRNGYGKIRMAEHVSSLRDELSKVLSNFRSYSWSDRVNAAKIEEKNPKSLSAVREKMDSLTPIQFIDLMHNTDDLIFLENFRLKGTYSASDLRRTIIVKTLEGFNKKDQACWGVDAFLEYFTTSSTNEYRSFFCSSYSFTVLLGTILKNHSAKSMATIFENAAQRVLSSFVLPICFQIDTPRTTGIS